MNKETFHLLFVQDRDSVQKSIQIFDYSKNRNATVYRHPSPEFNMLLQMYIKVSKTK